MPARWDVFCKVVDNYGDAGVAWRLARQLANEHSLDVTLWQDDLNVLARIAPGIDPGVTVQRNRGVTVRCWDNDMPDTRPPDAVIEAFGCGLPERYVRALAARSPRPAWFVLEYLSAESWIERSHALPSPHPRLPITRQFWFPGLTPKSGGLLRERGLIFARDAWRLGSSNEPAVWSALQMAPPHTGDLRILLFCYPGAPLSKLFDTWADGDRRITCMVPAGVAAGALDRWTAGDVPHPGHPVHRGRLSLHSVPFVDQDTFDRILWSCDINFVRGEDSFVRALWAARPFVWNVYPQPEGAHWAKLDAFLARYSESLEDGAARAHSRLTRAWNGDGDAGPIAEAWEEFAQASPRLALHGDAWAQRLAALPDFAGGLVSAARILV